MICFLNAFSAAAISLEKSTLWEASGKSFDMWICPLMYSLIECCNDVLLRYWFYLQNFVL